MNQHPHAGQAVRQHPSSTDRRRRKDSRYLGGWGARTLHVVWRRSMIGSSIVVLRRCCTLGSLQRHVLATASLWTGSGSTTALLYMVHAHRSLHACMHACARTGARTHLHGCTHAHQHARIVTCPGGERTARHTCMLHISLFLSAPAPAHVLTCMPCMNPLSSFTPPAVVHLDLRMCIHASMRACSHAPRSLFVC